MPGSIHVSVVDFKELPSNSVKVSLGKVEHEAGKEESFSFPLANLRDNLIITVQDHEGNQVSQSGVRTMSIIEKGIWDDVFPIEGGGIIHMKLQFFLSEEERNRIRLMRESAMKKKQAEILGRKHEVSQNVTDKREETSFPPMTHEIEQNPKSSNNVVEKLYETLKEKILNDVKKTYKESAMNKNSVISLRQAELSKKNNIAVKPEPLYDQVDNSDKQIFEDKNPSFIKKLRKESKFPPLSKETEVNAYKNNGNQVQTGLLRRLQDSSFTDMGSSRLTDAGKMKSFSLKLASEMDKRSSLEKIPQNIKEMISVFESTISQGEVSHKTVVQDYYEKSSSLKNSQDSISPSLRNSFSTGDLRQNLTYITTKGDQVDLNSFVEPSENIQSKGNDPKGTEIIGKEVITKNDNLPKAPHEGVNATQESVDTGKTSTLNLDYFNQDSSGRRTFLDDRRHFCVTAQGDKAISLLSDSNIGEKGHYEKVDPSIPETVVKDEGIESPESANIKVSNGSFGQAMKIALVVGFGVLAFVFRQRESGKGKKKENIHALRNQVFMNKRGSTEEQGRRFCVSRLS